MREVISLSKALILLNMGGINSPDEVEIFLKICLWIRISFH